MRLPWGRLEDIRATFVKDGNVAILGCLSTEERCCAVPIAFSHNHKPQICLLKISDPPDAFPDYTPEIKDRISKNADRLQQADIQFDELKAKLLSFEDDIIDILNAAISILGDQKCLILDITSLPKRFFCLILKRLIMSKRYPNVIVTYTQAGHKGYHAGALADDPMSPDNLPGFGADIKESENVIVVSLGFEALRLRQILNTYEESASAVKFIFSFPPNGEVMRRELKTARILCPDVDKLRSNRVVVSAWDTEQVISLLEYWNKDAKALTLAPFGPKPHSLAFALYAIQHHAGIYYTQPKSYHPDYTTGTGKTWAYIVMWDGIPCFDR